MPSGPVLHTHVSHQTPQYSLSTFLLTERPQGYPVQCSPSFSTGFYPSSFFLKPWRNTIHLHLFSSTIHEVTKRQLHEYVHRGIKKFQGLWWTALQFMFSMRTAGAVCVNRYSATVRCLVKPWERLCFLHSRQWWELTLELALQQE